jgi:tRNA uridine 5-carboxymethylaminomethyl modification enzyme
MSHTNEKTHKIIRDNLKESSLYGGEIVGTGVRYCPSIEDKIVKFTGVNAHHVMLEPEGLSDDDYIYPNGLSNSLPEKAQVDMVHSVEGLERAEFAKFGYAIEYSGIDSRELKSTLESKRIKCLYFAGQVNGTTGYEEAAAQGIIAGANAALKVQNREPLILSRNDAYIGVLIDDLITKGTNEPYRMFTSRAERRLILRQDNARYRLKNAAEKIGVLDKLLCDKINRDNLTVEKIIDFLDNSYYQNKSLSGILSRPGVKLVQMIEDFKNKFESLPESVKENLTSHVIKQTEIRVKYRGYIELEEKEVERDKKQENEKIPESFDYFSVDALRYESREKLSQVKPETLAQASRISGVTPADIAVLSTILYKNKKLSTKDK